MVNTLKSLIESRQMTGYRFAKETGISLRTTYALLNDPGIIPNGESMNAICKALGCQPGDFLKYIAEENKEDETTS